MLHIFDGDKTGCPGESPFESLVRQSRTFDKFLYWRRDLIMIRNPRLSHLYNGIAMIFFSLKYDIGLEPFMMPLQGEKPGNGLGCRRANMPGNDIQDQIDCRKFSSPLDLAVLERRIKLRSILCWRHGFNTAVL